jgi:ABC-2 type transport system permease protein
MMRGVGAVYLTELRKLGAQTRVWVVLALVTLGPWAFIFAINQQDRLPLETLFGRFLKTTGYATPFVVLVFSAQWLLPLLTAIVCGDIFSSEDQHRTLKTILTRSVGRRSVFAGKVAAAFTYATAAVVILAVSATLAGVVWVGSQPLIGLGGTTYTGGSALGVIAGSWALVVPPVLAFASLAILVSVLTRNSVLGVTVPVVIGLVMTLYVFLNGWDPIRHAMLTSPLQSWHGLVDSPAYFAPAAHGLVVSAVYVLAALAVAVVVFLRRDVQGS